MSPDGNFAFLADAAKILVVDFSAERVVGSVALPAGAGRIALSADGTRLYVAMPGACAVAVIDTASRTVVATVAVDENPRAMAIGAAAPPSPTPTPVPPSPTPAPGGAGVCAYIVHGALTARGRISLVSVIDTATQSVVGALPVPRALRVAPHPDGTRAYVSSSTDDGITGALAVIDTASNTVAGRFILGSLPFSIAVGLDGTAAYTGIFASPCYSLFAVDTATGLITQRSASSDPVAPPRGEFSFSSAVALTPDGRRIYVARIIGSQGAVAVIDAATGATTATIAVDQAPRGLAVTPDGRFAYVSLEDVGRSLVGVIDTASDEVVATVLLGTSTTHSSASGVAVRPDGRFVYVSHRDAPTASISVIDTATNQVSASVPADLASLALAFTPDGAFAYVANLGDSLSIIDTATTTVVNRLPIPEGAVDMAIGSVAYGCVRPPIPCLGDCNGDGAVTIDELVTGIGVALGESRLVSCLLFDDGGDGRVTIDELLAAVNNALNGCAASALGPVTPL